VWKKCGRRWTSGGQHRLREHEPPVRDQQHEEAGDEAEHAAPRQGRELDREQGRDQHRERRLEPVAAL